MYAYIDTHFVPRVVKIPFIARNLMEFDSLHCALVALVLIPWDGIAILQNYN